MDFRLKQMQPLIWSMHFCVFFLSKFVLLMLVSAVCKVNFEVEPHCTKCFDGPDISVLFMDLRLSKTTR